MNKATAVKKQDHNPAKNRHFAGYGYRPPV